MKNLFRHLFAFSVPVLVCIVMPWSILKREQGADFPSLAASRPVLITGLVLTLAGLLLWIAFVALFIRLGRGTIMPWSPTTCLVTSGPYAYVRNPIILCVIVFLLGLAFLFASWQIGMLVLTFYIINAWYFVGLEEPALEKRFGADYLEYTRNVPRWIPRFRPWKRQGR